MKGGVKMKKKNVSMLMAGTLILSLFLIVSVSAVQLRPMNQIDHPGLTNPYHPQADGSNHIGVSDYSSNYTGFSELCEDDHQIRPANQGLNIPRFYYCPDNY